MSIIPALRRQRQVDHELYIYTLSQKQTKIQIRKDHSSAKDL
jgi:hypothetical protein